MPVDKRRLMLRWPSGGLDKRYAYQNQPPYTTPLAKNVRPMASIEGRERGGSRPGLEKAFYERLDSGKPIRMLGEVEHLKSDKSDFWADDFKGESIGGVWTLGSWVDQTGGASFVTGASLPVEGRGVEFAYTRLALSSFDASSAYQVELYLVPYQGKYFGRHVIYLRMHDSTPVWATDGVRVVLDLHGSSGVYSGEVWDVTSGSPTVTVLTPGTISSAKPGWFRALVTADNLKVYWHGTKIYDATISSAAGKRIGWGLHYTSPDAGHVQVDTFRISYTRSDTREWPRRLMCASTGDEFWRESRLGELTEITFSPTITLNSDELILSASFLQRLIVADHGPPRAAATDGVLSGTSLDSASYADWTALGIDVAADLVEIISGTGATKGTYKVSVLATGAITLDRSAGTATGVTFRIARAAKIYNPKDDTMVLLQAASGKGSVPLGCKVIARYQDRILMGGADHDPHLIYASRQGDETDWDYGADGGDVSRAWSLTTAEAGALGERVTALLPWKDDYCIIGCTRSLWLMRGNIASQGSVDNISQTIGIVDRGAWCRGPNGEIVFLSGEGIYKLPASGAGIPEALSKNRMPRELLDVDFRLYTVLMEYDVRDRGVHIYMTPVDSRVITHFWFDWVTQSFWPVSIDNDHEPTSLMQYDGSYREDSAVMLGCRDGYIRRHQNHATTDDGAEFISNVMYGPFALGGDAFTEGMIHELSAQMHSSSGGVIFEVRASELAEDVSSLDLSDPQETGVWGAARSINEHVRAAGVYGTIKVDNERDTVLKLESGDAFLLESSDKLLLELPSGRSWAIEGINMVLARKGRHRPK